MGNENNNKVLPLKGCPEGFVKADLLARSIARIIDMMIFATLSSFGNIGLIAALLYVLVADGLMDGRSIGKKIIGLRVILDPQMEPAGYKESIVRNAPMAILGLFAVIPVIGWVLLLTVGVIIIGLSIYLALTDERGRRAGDILARTLVVPSKCLAENGITSETVANETEKQTDNDTSAAFDETKEQ